jgi:hypothetical protein
MKLPSGIRGKNRIRDSVICSLWAEGESTAAELGERYGISARRVHAILNNNSEFLQSRKEWEKVKRKAHLKRLLVKHPDTLGKKGTLDILEQLRTEDEGSKEANNTNVTVVVMPNIKKDNQTMEFNIGSRITQDA